MNRLTLHQQKTKEETVPVFSGEVRMENVLISFLPQRNIHASAITFCIVQYIWIRYSKKCNRKVDAQVFESFNYK